MATKEQDKAAQDAHAIELFARFEAAVAEVAPERGPKRVKAIRLAAELIDAGYSLRTAAKLAGRKPDTSHDRYFTVARAMLADSTDKPIPTPEGFGNWLDAIAGVALPKLVEHVKAHRTPSKLAPADKAMRGAINSALRSLEMLAAGKAKGKAVHGLSIGKAQLTAYVEAWITAGFSIKGLDSMTLTPLDAKGAEVVAEIKASAVADAAQAVRDALVETGEAQEQTQELHQETQAA